MYPFERRQGRCCRQATAEAVRLPKRQASAVPVVTVSSPPASSDADAALSASRAARAAAGVVGRPAVHYPSEHHNKRT